MDEIAETVFAENQTSATSTGDAGKKSGSRKDRVRRDPGGREPVRIELERRFAPNAEMQVRALRVLLQDS